MVEYAMVLALIVLVLVGIVARVGTLTQPFFTLSNSL
jgi:Flp pilus assembly pilin Flp